MNDQKHGSRERTNPPPKAISPARNLEPFRIFLSYTHIDENFREALDKHLSPLLLLGRAETWHDRHIQAGARLYEKIQTNIDGAHIILMLISADYLASKACQGEMSTALRKSEEGTAVAIPIVVRACNWEILPIGSLLAANEDGTPINSQSDHDVAWTQVAMKIGEIINDWQSQRPAGEALDDHIPGTAAAEGERSKKPGSTDEPGEHWVNRREDNDMAWEEAKTELVEALGNVSASESGTNVTLNVRKWGDKIIIDFTLPQYRNPRRLLVRDIGGTVGFPGYQLETYPSDARVKIDTSRVRWLTARDGSRILRQTASAVTDMTVQDFARELWRKMSALAKS